MGKPYKEHEMIDRDKADSSRACHQKMHPESGLSTKDIAMAMDLQNVSAQAKRQIISARQLHGPHPGGPKTIHVYAVC